MTHQIIVQILLTHMITGAKDGGKDGKTHGNLDAVMVVGNIILMKIAR
jgi:hypothetical protein